MRKGDKQLKRSDPFDIQPNQDLIKVSENMQICDSSEESIRVFSNGDNSSTHLVSSK